MSGARGLYRMVSHSVSGTSYTVSGLEAGQQYQVRVRAGADGVFASEGCEAYVPLSIGRESSATASVRVEDVHGDRLTLVWAGVSGADH